jgi:hypothetical protein
VQAYAIAYYNSLRRSGTLPCMGEEKQFAVIQLPELKWPTSLSLSCSRFRLFVAADVSNVSVDIISDFVSAALNRGMVYFCAWGHDCERFHDIVDEVVVEDYLAERRFVEPTTNDTVMTTWHKGETLDTLKEALDFFANWARPHPGLATDSSFRLVICVGDPEWAETATRFLQTAEFFI